MIINEARVAPEPQETLACLPPHLYKRTNEEVVMKTYEILPHIIRSAKKSEQANAIHYARHGAVKCHQCMSLVDGDWMGRLAMIPPAHQQIMIDHRARTTCAICWPKWVRGYIGRSIAHNIKTAGLNGERAYIDWLYSKWIKFTRPQIGKGNALKAKKEERWAMYGSKCWICGRDAEQTDHVKPKCSGGFLVDIPCNLRPICKKCNHRKSGKWPFPLDSKTAYDTLWTR